MRTISSLPDFSTTAKGPSNSRHAATRRSDEYYTPDNAIAILLPYLPKKKIIWECAWGQGHLARYLQARRYTVVGGPDEDFFASTVEFDLLVTNPPYSKKNDFLRRAYSLGKPFAMLLPADSLVGMKRHPFFARHGIQLLIPNRRIQFIPQTSEKRSCNFNSFWFCWRSEEPHV